jgi:hypothetical protein
MKILACVLALCTLVLGILCAVQWKQLGAAHARARAVEAALRAEAESRETQAAQVKNLEQVNQRLEQQVQQFTSLTASLRSNEVRQSSNISLWNEQMRSARQTAGTNAGAGSEGLFGKDMGQMLGKMMKDPAMREMMREQQKAAINMMYGALFKELNLSPEEKDKLKGLLTDAQLRNLETAQSFLGDKKDDASEDAQKAIAAAKNQTDAEIKALLGEERFALYEDYKKNMGERMQLDQLKTRLASEKLPLQDEQAAQLLQILKEEKAAVPPVIPTDNTQFPKKELMTAENLDKQLAWMEDYNRRVLERAGQVLTPEQLKQYREFQEQQASMQKLGLNMTRQMFGAGKSANPAPPVPVK